MRVQDSRLGIGMFALAGKGELATALSIRVRSTALTLPAPVKNEFCEELREIMTKQIQRMLQLVKPFQYLLHGSRF